MIRTFTEAIDQAMAVATAWRQKRARDTRSRFAHLTPRVVVREDGFAYITFSRPRPQKGIP